MWKKWARRQLDRPGMPRVRRAAQMGLAADQQRGQGVAAVAVGLLHRQGARGDRDQGQDPGRQHRDQVRQGLPRQLAEPRREEVVRRRFWYQWLCHLGQDELAWRCVAG